MSSRIGLAALIAVGGLLIAVPSAHADCGSLGGVTFDIITVPPYPGAQMIYVGVIENPGLSGNALVGQPFCLPAGSYTLGSGMFPTYGANIGPVAQAAYVFGTATCVGTTQVTCSPSSFSATEYYSGARVHGTVKNNGQSVGPGVLINVFSVDRNIPIGFPPGGEPRTDASGSFFLDTNAVGVLQYSYSESGTQTYQFSISKDCSAVVTLTSNGDGQANLDCVDLPPPAPKPPCGRNAPPPPPANAGEPVNVITGDVWLRHQDVSIPGLAGLSLVRRYDSDYANRGLSGAFGYGWHHSFERTLTILSPQAVRLRGEDGSPIVFRDDDGDLTYTAYKPVTESSWIVKSVQGTFTRYFPEGGSEAYDATGRLTGVQDKSGNPLSLTYDTGGHLTTVVDGGRSLGFEYDGSGHVSRLSGPDGPIASYTYDAGPLTKVSYADGTGYTFTYSGNDLTSVTDFSGRIVERHAYDAQGRGTLSELQDGVQRYTFSYGAVQTTVTDALGNVTTYNWFPIGGLPYVTKITGPCSGCGGGGGQVQQWTYDSVGRITGYIDGAGKATTYGYDANNNVNLITDPLNHQTTMTWDSQHRMLTKTGPDGSLVTYVQGPAGPTSITEKVTTTQNRTTGITYTAAGKPWTITDPRGKATTLSYNATGDLTSVSDPLTHATGFGYDIMGRRTTVTDALTHVTTTTYDTRGRVTRITSHDGTHSDFAYDTSGRRTGVTDPLGRTTAYLYDAYGRLEKVVDPLQGVTVYAYDAMSQLTSLTDANGHTTTFHYDGYGRVDTVTYPSGAFPSTGETFTYDAAGRLLTKTDRKGVTTTFAYYDDGRLWKKTYSGGTPPVTDPPEVFTYDPAGHLLTAANGTDTLTWAYDLAGQLLSEQSSKNASTVAYTYDLGGNRLSLSLDGTLFVSYAYDDVSRLTTITRGTNVFGFGYDYANRRTSLTHPNGVSTSYSYDNLNRITNLAAVLNGTTPVTNFAYVYDAAGNRTRKQQLDYTEDYGYDRLYRLTAVSRTGSAPPSQWAYGYDLVGNRITEQVDNSLLTAVYDQRNELTARGTGGSLALHLRGTLSEPGTVTVNSAPARMSTGNTFDADVTAGSGTNTLSLVARDVSGNQTTANYSVSLSGTGATYTYDANGNLTQKVDSGVTTTYTWDAQNRLTQVQNNGSTVATFAYDPLGRRVQKVAGSVTTTWTYDGPGILRQVSGASTLKYVPGFGIDEPLASDDGTALSYFHGDGLGSITKTTSAAGAVTLTRQYDAWGGLQAGGSTAGFAYTGREWDPETNLHYYRARYYDPKIGRFISEDPIGFQGGENFYAYVVNNPANFTDPSGLQFAPGQGYITGQGYVTNQPPADCELDCMCMANCIEQFRFSNVWTLGANTANAAGNVTAGLTPRGGLGIPSHPTSWQHTAARNLRVACKLPRTPGTFGRTMQTAGKVAGRAAIAATIFEGFYDWGLIGYCAATCTTCKCGK